MDIKELTEQYLRYSIWWLKEGTKLHEIETAQMRKAIEVEMSSGLSESEAYKKVSKSMPSAVDHSDQEGAWEVRNIIDKGNDLSWEYLKAIVNAAPEDKELLCYMGAGPFENWISAVDYNVYKQELIALIDSDRKWRIVSAASWHNPSELESYLDNLYKKEPWQTKGGA